MSLTNYIMDFADSEDTIVDLVCQSTASEFFDQVIGHIEDIVLSEKFQKLHIEFLEKYWSKFENKDENKLECMDIFEEYNSLFESFFMDELHQRMDSFDMKKFIEELNMRVNLQNSLDIMDSEIFELLYSFSNFQVFKSLMLDYRLEKEGYVQHLNANILTTKSLKQKIDS